MNLKRLNDDITLTVASGLHQYENLEKIKNMGTAAEVTAAVEGGTQRYLDDPAFRAKVQMLVARIMACVVDATSPPQRDESS